VEAHLLLKGTYFDVYALVKRARPIYEEELYHKIDEQTKNKIFGYIDFLANTQPPITNRHISRKISGYPNLFELRPKNVRLFYFLVGNRAIIIHGFVKKSRKAPKEELERAENLKRQFLSEE
jgi:hypothetical protein